MKLLIGRVDAVIGQPKAHQHRWDSKRLLKRIDHGNRAAGAQEDRKSSKSFLIGKGGRLHCGVFTAHQGGLDRRKYFYRYLRARWCDSSDVPAKETAYPFWILVRHQTKTQLDYSACWDYSLDAGAVMAAGNAVER